VRHGFDESVVDEEDVNQNISIVSDKRWYLELEVALFYSLDSALDYM
jgi:hypothetical protein